jgi:hypothetical protein
VELPGGEQHTNSCTLLPLSTISTIVMSQHDKQRFLLLLLLLTLIQQQHAWEQASLP